MRDFIVFVGIKAWALIADGWRPLVESEKFFEEDQRLVSFGTRVSQWNFKALHIFLMGISEFRRISTCEYAREACDILKNTHDGTNAEEVSKIQTLTTEFENLILLDDEWFDHFYTKLIDIVNFSFKGSQKI